MYTPGFRPCPSEKVPPKGFTVSQSIGHMDEMAAMPILCTHNKRISHMNKTCHISQLATYNHVY